MAAGWKTRRCGELEAGKAEIRPGEVLLSLGSRFELEPGEREALARAAREASPAEWEEVIEEALFRWTGGVLCHHLRGAGVEPPPRLQEEYRRIALEAVLGEAELKRLGPALREEGARVLLIKGAALKGLIYANPGLRPTDDSDWVVRTPGEWEAACRALAALGYRPSKGGLGATWERGRFVVELHRNVIGDERVEARVPAGGGGGPGGGADGAVWARSRPAPLGEPFWAPAPEDHLLILCAHLMKHSFEPGIWFTDLEALLRAEPALGWGAVISRAGEWGLLRPLAYSLRSLGLLEGPRFGAPALALPAAARGALMAAMPGPLDRLLLSLAGRSTRLRGEKEEWERPPIANLLWLSSREGLGAKLGLLWEAAFPRHEVMGQIYPGYRPALRGWFLLRRAADLLRLALRLAARLGRGR